MHARTLKEFFGGFSINPIVDLGIKEDTKNITKMRINRGHQRIDFYLKMFFFINNIKYNTNDINIFKEMIRSFFQARPDVQKAYIFVRNF